MAAPRILQIHDIMLETTHIKLTLKAQHLEQTQKFISSIEEALVHFNDETSSLNETTWAHACKVFLNSYKEALAHIWSLARFADVKIILQTISDIDMTSLKDMAKKLQPALLTAKVAKENHKIPDLDTVSSTFKEKCPSQNIPDARVCKQIADVLYKLAAVHKVYGDTAEGLQTWHPK